MVYIYIFYYANMWDILIVNVTIYSIHGSYGYIHSNHPMSLQGMFKTGNV